MDNEVVTARSLGRTYMINGDTLGRNYKEVLSGYLKWEQKDHASDWVLLAKNIGPRTGIDETSLDNELYTIIHNKDSHGRKGAIIAIIKGTNPADILKVLYQLPKEIRENVTSTTMDLSDTMRAIVRDAFPNARVTRDCFHVIMRGGEGIEELRLRFKREAIKSLKKQKTEFRKHLESLAKARKRYAAKMKESHGGKWRKSKRGRKPQRMKTRFEPERLANGETLVEALTRCRKQLMKSREKWTEKQEERAKILFEIYPKLEEAYYLINSLRALFRNKSLNKETAKEKLHEWYGKVTESTLREIKSVRDTIKSYEDEILNYFIDRETNASAESLNSKIKCFRSELKGVSDCSFFMYRVATVLG